MAITKILSVVDYVDHLEIMRNFLGKAGLEIEITEDRNKLLPQSIGNYDIFLDYTHGGKLTDEQAESVMKFVSEGKALVGIHSAAVDKQSPKYTKLLGGEYAGHSDEAPSKVTVIDSVHPITSGISDFEIVDEIYKLDYEPNSFQTLITSTVQGIVCPVCWIKEYGRGKVTFLSLGHGQQAFENSNFQELVIRMVRWAIK